MVFILSQFIDNREAHFNAVILKGIWPLCFNQCVHEGCYTGQGDISEHARITSVSMKSEKDAYRDALSMFSITAKEVESISLDQYCGSQFTVDDFSEGTKVFIIPRRSTTISGSPTCGRNSSAVSLTRRWISSANITGERIRRCNSLLTRGPRDGRYSREERTE